MATSIKGPYPTRAIAEAFVEGIEYANDSALTVLAIRYHRFKTSAKPKKPPSRSAGWYVELDDTDKAS